MPSTVLTTGARSLLPLGQQLLEQRAIRGRIPIFGAHPFLANDAVFTNDVRLWHARRPIDRLDGAGIVVQELERELVLALEIADLLLESRLINADGNNVQSLRREILVHGLDARHLGAARNAVRRPDVEQ